MGPFYLTLTHCTQAQEGPGLCLPHVSISRVYCPTKISPSHPRLVLCKHGLGEGKGMSRREGAATEKSDGLKIKVQQETG